MANHSSRLCQICHGKALRIGPAWWACDRCGHRWQIGMNPVTAARRRTQTKSNADEGTRQW